jgi:hypothetical protein
MMRSPLFYPLSRGGDSEASGTAELQTDVMRFMAIISLCLVAIFALVQSIPISAVPGNPVETGIVAIAQPTELLPKVDAGPEQAITPIAEKVVEVELTRPTPTRMTTREKSVVLQHPVAVRVAPPAPDASSAAVPVENATPSEETTSEEGFILRFETDDALNRLVARHVVGLYAITSEKSQRMNIAGDEISFWPASIPGQFHEMDQSTVPDNVLLAFRRGNDIEGVKWGVTLPADMSNELNGYLSKERGGSLIIAGNGQISLRH